MVLFGRPVRFCSHLFSNSLAVNHCDFLIREISAFRPYILDLTFVMCMGCGFAASLCR